MAVARRRTKRTIGNVLCPRCNAVSDVRAVPYSDRGDFLRVSIRCSHCKLDRMIGFTTEGAMRLYRKGEILGRLLARETDPSKRDGIRAAIDRLADEQARRDLWLS